MEPVINYIRLINWQKTTESLPHSNCFICVRDTMSLSYARLINQLTENYGIFGTQKVISVCMWHSVHLRSMTKTMESVPHNNWTPSVRDTLFIDHVRLINWQKTMESLRHSNCFIRVRDTMSISYIWLIN